MEKRKTTISFYTGIFYVLLLAVGIVTWMSSDLLFEDRFIPFRRRLVQAGRLAGYIVWLLGQIVLANIFLLRLAFSKREAIQPQIVRYESALKSDFEKFLLANSITLTPGTVTIKILGSTYYVHAINDEAAAGLNGEMERRIARIFAEPQASPVGGRATSA